MILAPEEIAMALRRQPLVPFRVTLTEGSPYEVRHPELCMIGRYSAINGKASEVRVARQGLLPLSGLITSRRCVTLSAVTA